MMYVGSLLRGIGIVLAACLSAAVLGAGVPMAWIWLASRVESTTGNGVSSLAALIVILGPLATYAVFVMVAGRFTAGQRQHDRPARMAWNRSRDEIRQSGPQVTTFDQVVILATLIIAVCFEVWFFFFAHCSSAKCFG